jgi:predicted nucleic acid-binding protein
MIIISDTSPLSSLALVGYLSILKDIYTNVIIPQAVANELANLTEEDIRIKAIISLNWIQVKQAANLELVACLSNDYNLESWRSRSNRSCLRIKGG